MTDGTIGKFQVLSKISQGGMADIYRCRLRGIGGFEKIVALKRIRADRVRDPDFVSMFLDEARLAGSLSHPHIVQVFEIGEVDGAPYIAMEYVEGPTLAQLIRQQRRAGRFQLAPMVKIAADIAAGLHHAHSACGPSGEPLGLVHRDVSPQNIVISRPGVPKLLDFGVAKAKGRLTETKAGTLKGKLRYMAPEQLSGTIDQRADVFALGVCLFEATTGQSPYGADDVDEVALFKNILSGQHARPSQLVPGYPRGLEDIVLWALQTDPTKRCSSALQLQKSLEEILTRDPLSIGAGAVRDLVAELFPAELAASPGEGLVPDGKAGPEGARPDLTVPSRGDLVSTAVERVTSLPRPAPDGRTSAEADGPRRGRPLRRRLALAAAGAAGLGALALGAQLNWPRDRRPVQPAGASSQAAPVQALSPPPPPAQELPAQRPDEPFTPAAAVALRTAAPTDAPGAERAGLASTAAAGKRRARVALVHPPRSDLAAPNRTPATPMPAATTAHPEPHAIYSATPSPLLPQPALPRSYTPSSPADLDHMLTQVEDETVKAGCSLEFARGITAPLNRALQGRSAAVIYPWAMYYFIVREAGLGQEKQAAAAHLAEAHNRGFVRVLSQQVEKRRR